jgi:hypothetical protein
MSCGALWKIWRVGAGAGGRPTAISFYANRHWDRLDLPLAATTNLPARGRGSGGIGWRDIPLAGDRAAGDFVRLPRRLGVARAAAAAVAHAHLTNTGFGPFYDGLAHRFVTPEHLLPVIAPAMLAGLHGPRFGRTILFALPAVCLAGGLAGLLAHLSGRMPAVTAVTSTVLGAWAVRPL